MKNDRPDKYFFNGIYSEAKQFHFCYDESILEDILRYKKSGSVLDLGCGVRGLGFALSERGFDVTGVDISEVAIKLLQGEAKRRGLGIELIEADLESYEIDKKYDVIICNKVLQFLGRDGQEKVRDIQGKTKKGGINVVDALLNRHINRDDLERLYQGWEVSGEKVYDMKLMKNGKISKVFYMVARK